MGSIVSRLAVGSPLPSPASYVVVLPADLTQEDHFEGLPFGTRGGTAVRHTFPLDGTYDFQIRVSRDRNENVEGGCGAAEPGNEPVLCGLPPAPGEPAPADNTTRQPASRTSQRFVIRASQCPCGHKDTAKSAQVPGGSCLSGIRPALGKHSGFGREDLSNPRRMTIVSFCGFRVVDPTLRSDTRVMDGTHQEWRDARSSKARGPYVLIVRGPDGHPRLERFDDLEAYRARLVTLLPSPADSVSIEDIVGLLEA